MTLCTPCYNVEVAQMIPEDITYTPSLSEDESCGKCGQGPIKERKMMGLERW